MALNSGSLLGQGLNAQSQMTPSWRRNPFYFTNFIGMQEAHNKKQLIFLTLRTWHLKIFISLFAT